jgi:hypothetical protein
MLTDGVLTAQLGDFGFTNTVNLPVEVNSPLTFDTSEPGLQDPSHDYCAVVSQRA